MIINAHDHLAEVWKLMIQKRKTIISRSSDSACNARPVNSGNARYELAVRKTKIMTARCGRVALSRVGTNLGRRRAQKLAGGNVAIALLCNTILTGAILVVLILIFAPISGAHLIPAVSIAFALQRELLWSMAAGYIAAQIIGAVVGVWAAHFMFELPVWQFSVTSRAGAGRWLAEAVATFGLLLTICGCAARRRPPFPTRSASTSPWPIGSPHRHPSPIQP
jgi:hypothetical protein